MANSTGTVFFHKNRYQCLSVSEEEATTDDVEDNLREVPSRSTDNADDNLRKVTSISTENFEDNLREVTRRSTDDVEDNLREVTSRSTDDVDDNLREETSRSTDDVDDNLREVTSRSTDNVNDNLREETSISTENFKDNLREVTRRSTDDVEDNLREVTSRSTDDVDDNLREETSRSTDDVDDNLREVTSRSTDNVDDNLREVTRRSTQNNNGQSDIQTIQDNEEGYQQISRRKKKKHKVEMKTTDLKNESSDKVKIKSFKTNPPKRVKQKLRAEIILYQKKKSRTAEKIPTMAGNINTRNSKNEKCRKETILYQRKTTKTANKIPPMAGNTNNSNTRNSNNKRTKHKKNKDYIQLNTDTEVNESPPKRVEQKCRTETILYQRETSLTAEKIPTMAGNINNNNMNKKITMPRPGINKNTSVPACGGYVRKSRTMPKMGIIKSTKPNWGSYINKSTTKPQHGISKKNPSTSFRKGWHAKPKIPKPKKFHKVKVMRKMRPSDIPGVQLLKPVKCKRRSWDILDALIEGREHISNFPALTLVNENGNWASINTVFLEAYQKYETYLRQAGTDLKVPVIYWDHVSWKNFSKLAKAGAVRSEPLPRGEIGIKQHKVQDFHLRSKRRNSTMFKINKLELAGLRKGYDCFIDENEIHPKTVGKFKMSHIRFNNTRARVIADSVYSWVEGKRLSIRQQPTLADFFPKPLVLMFHL